MKKLKTIETARQFEKDLKQLGLLAELVDVLHYLVNDLLVPENYNDHQLKGNLKKYRECHLKPDLLLAYQITDDSVKLIAIDKHSNLFKILSNRE